MLKAAANTQKQLNLVKLHEQSKKNLEQEILNYKEEAQKQRKIIYQLEKERDRYINEASDLTQKVCFHVSLIFSASVKLKCVLFNQSIPFTWLIHLVYLQCWLCLIP